MPTPDEWEYACGAGAATVFRWGDTYPAGAPYPAVVGPHRLPNAFGLAIGADPYLDERTSDPEVLCGGDGGTMICGGAGQFMSWLTLATAYQDPYRAEVGEEYEGQSIIRAVIPVG